MCASPKKHECVRCRPRGSWCTIIPHVPSTWVPTSLLHLSYLSRIQRIREELIKWREAEQAKSRLITEDYVNKYKQIPANDCSNRDDWPESLVWADSIKPGRVNPNKTEFFLLICSFRKKKKICTPLDLITYLLNKQISSNCSNLN